MIHGYQITISFYQIFYFYNHTNLTFLKNLLTNSTDFFSCFPDINFTRTNSCPRIQFYDTEISFTMIVKNVKSAYDICHIPEIPVDIPPQIPYNKHVHSVCSSNRRKREYPCAFI